MLNRLCTLLLFIELLLGAAHLLIPEYTWGQGRSSYFNLANSLTLASWLTAMILLAMAGLMLANFHQEGRRLRGASGRWPWLVWALCALTLSFAEMTRFPRRLELLGLPHPTLYNRLVLCGVGGGLLVLFGSFLYSRLHGSSETRIQAFTGVFAWFGAMILTFAFSSEASHHRLFAHLLLGMLPLVGSTLLLQCLGNALFGQGREDALRHRDDFPLRSGWRSATVVAGAAFVAIFVQIIHHQLLTITGNYLTAQGIISTAVLGIAVGGIIGHYTSLSTPLKSLLLASFLLPAGILASFGACVSLVDSPLLAAMVIALPYIACGTLITVILAHVRSHVVYFVDLVAAASGALAAASCLSTYREEGSMLLVGAIASLLALIPASAVRSAWIRRELMGVALLASIGFTGATYLNQAHDLVNVVRDDFLGRFPKGEVLFSRSSLVGRYDIVRRRPGSSVLKALENGRVTDTIREQPAERYRIDPRVPSSLIQKPNILILGLSGDAITKTARALGGEVVGLELNPVVVELQTGPLRALNGDSYQGIEVHASDGRGYVARSERRFDIITLMNAHLSKGGALGRSANPEYLSTREAFLDYLEHLSDRGFVDIEEPINSPLREPSVWKLLVTMRQALVDSGVSSPERHFFLFQWRTRSNNYVQILMKKTPFEQAELDGLREWLSAVDNIRKIEDREGQWMGPIRAITTLLYSPDEHRDSNYSRIITGKASRRFLWRHGLKATSDDRPFPFDVDITHSETRGVYGRTLLMLLPLLPFFFLFLRRHRARLGLLGPHLVVVALTGLAYFLVEVVLMQRFQLFLGAPVLSFSVVLGSMLAFSGLGSLWCSRQSGISVRNALILLVFLLLAFLLLSSSTLGPDVQLSLLARVLISVIAIAPLAFLMGVPFPYVLQQSKEFAGPDAAPLLFAVNAACGALAVPLSMNISTVLGKRAVFSLSAVLYLAVLLSLTVLAIRKGVIKAASSPTGLQPDPDELMKAEPDGPVKGTVRRSERAEGRSGLFSAFAAKRRKVILAVNILLVLVVIAFPWWVPTEAEPGGLREALYDVYAIRYGQSRLEQSLVYSHGAKNKTVKGAWYVWLIRGNGRTILMDTGTNDPREVARWRIRNFVEPSLKLQQLGVSPDEVSDVVLSHAHWDHMGDLGPYKKARFWIQETEYQHATTLVSQRHSRKKGLRWKDVQALLEVERQGRLERVDGARPLAEGIDLMPLGVHTPGMQGLRVETPSGSVLLAADATYLYKNNRKHRAIGGGADPESSLKLIRRLQGLAASPYYLLPGHDPRVLRYFRGRSEGFARISPGTEYRSDD